MRIFKTLILLLIILIFSENSFAGKLKKIIKPVNAKEKVNLEILGKQYTYYSLEKSKPLILKVTGPAKIKIYTRAMLPKKIEKTHYTIKYVIDNKKKKIKKFHNIPFSKKAIFTTGEYKYSSQNRNITIKIRKGKHTIKIYANPENVKVYAKFQLIKKSKKRKWIVIEPLKPKEPVLLIANEEILSYFRSNSNSPVVVSVIGPTKLRILSRAEDANSQKKTIKYGIKIISKTDEEKSFLLWTNRSHSVNYKDDVNFVACKAKEIILDVPEGLHYYSIYPEGETKSVIVRLFIPYKDVNVGLK